MTLRIKHCSDWHSEFQKLTGHFDLVVFSGDMEPNSKAVFNGDRAQEAAFQLSWYRNNYQNIKQLVQNKPLLMSSGNHTFCDLAIVATELTNFGVETYCLDNKLIEVKHHLFYGFPYVNVINATWNFETQPEEMQKQVAKLTDIINNNFVDVLVCHGPLAGILDYEPHHNMRYGNRVLADAFNYQWDNDHLPQAVLSGHCHNDAGVKVVNDVLFSNAALTQNIIEID